MNCDSLLSLISLYYYGELTPDEEDKVEQHLVGCAKCGIEMERHRKLAAALDQRIAPIPRLLLDDCRADLMAAIQGGAPHASRTLRNAKGPWTLFLEALASTFSGMGRMRQPLGATALIAIGFFAARITPNLQQIMRGNFTAASIAGDDVFSTVRSVQPDSSGRVQISLDETRRRVLSGRIDDPAIQRYVLAAAREENPAVRVESVDLLNLHSESTEARGILLNLLAHDPNAGVRLKALEKLKPLAGDPEVRKILSQALLADENPAVRMQVVDLLVAHRDDSMVGMLQNLMQREDNGYVRLKCEKALKDMNASLGTF